MMRANAFNYGRAENSEIPGWTNGIDWIKKTALLSQAIIGLLLQSCASIPPAIPADWSEKAFFRKAQDAVELDQYNLANYYYDVFMVRYPENQPLIIAAQYEKAFIMYKQEKYHEAEATYQSILELYKTNPNSVTFMPRFQRLAEIGLKTIAWKRQVNKKFFWRSAWTNWAEKNGENLIDPSASPG